MATLKDVFASADLADLGQEKLVAAEAAANDLFGSEKDPIAAMAALNSAALARVLGLSKIEAGAVLATVKQVVASVTSETKVEVKAEVVMPSAPPTAAEKLAAEKARLEARAAGVNPIASQFAAQMSARDIDPKAVVNGVVLIADAFERRFGDPAMVLADVCARLDGTKGSPIIVEDDGLLALLMEYSDLLAAPNVTLVNPVRRDKAAEATFRALVNSKLAEALTVAARYHLVFQDVNGGAMQVAGSVGVSQGKALDMIMDFFESLTALGRSSFASAIAAKLRTSKEKYVVGALMHPALPQALGVAVKPGQEAQALQKVITAQYGKPIVDMLRAEVLWGEFLKYALLLIDEPGSPAMIDEIGKVAEPLIGVLAKYDPDGGAEAEAAVRGDSFPRRNESRDRDDEAVVRPELVSEQRHGWSKFEFRLGARVVASVSRS